MIPKDVAAAIHDAASEMSFGAFDDHFPLDVFQTGSGTSTNMNANEVLAAVASQRLGRPVHANDHVNAPQSSNDVFPSALRLAACWLIVRRLIPALDHLHAELRRLARAHARTVKAGRTHPMGAAPVTFGQEAGGWARQVELSRSGCSTSYPASASSRSVALRSAPGSTPRRASPATSSPSSPRTWACR